MTRRGRCQISDNVTRPHRSLNLEPPAGARHVVKPPGARLRAQPVLFWADCTTLTSGQRRDGILAPYSRGTRPHDCQIVSLDVSRRLRSDDVLARLAQLFVERGPPAYLRSDNGPEFTATAVRDWLTRVGVTTRFIEPDSPWENGSVESFNGKLRDECLNRERFDTLLEAQVLIEGWRREYKPNPAPQCARLPSTRPRSAGDPTSPPRPLGRPEGRSTNFSTGTTIGGRSLHRTGQSLGRTGLWNPSTASSATRVSIRRSSRPAPKPRSASSAGAASTTRSGRTAPSTTARPPQKRWRSDLPTPPPGQTGGSQHELQHWHNNRGQVRRAHAKRDMPRSL